MVVRRVQIGTPQGVIIPSFSFIIISYSVTYSIRAGEPGTVGNVCIFVLQRGGSVVSYSV